MVFQKFVISFQCKGKGKGSCLESMPNNNECSTDFIFPLARWAPMKPTAIGPVLDLLRAPGTIMAWWTAHDSMEFEIYPTLLHMASTGNQTLDIMILSPTPYPLGHMQ